MSSGHMGIATGSPGQATTLRLAGQDVVDRYWHDADVAAASAEGWNVFVGLQGPAILRKEYGDVRFESDALAIGYVYMKAHQGSEMHQRALFLTLSAMQGFQLSAYAPFAGGAVIGIQEAWEAAGGNPGIRASKQELIDALQAMDAAVDEADEAAPAHVQAGGHVYPAGAPADRIEGVVVMAQATGKAADAPRERQQVRFDATATVLAMKLDDIRCLGVDYALMDQVGQKHVSCAEPFEVHIGAATATFFGVEWLDDIDQEMLDAKRSQYGVEPEYEDMKP